MSENISASTGSDQNLAGKYLSFKLQRESYAIGVLKVREIIRLVNITTVPQMPDYVRGVINLRGKIIPVIDLRLRFGLGEANTTEQTCIVVVVLRMPNGQSLQMGMVVDTVEEVLNLSATDIEPSPDFGAQVTSEFVLGIAKVKGNVKLILDIERVVARGTLSELAAI